MNPNDPSNLAKGDPVFPPNPNSTGTVIMGGKDDLMPDVRLQINHASHTINPNSSSQHTPSKREVLRNVYPQPPSVYVPLYDAGKSPGSPGSSGNLAVQGNSRGTAFYSLPRQGNGSRSDESQAVESAQDLTGRLEYS